GEATAAIWDSAADDVDRWPRGARGYVAWTPSQQRPPESGYYNVVRFPFPEGVWKPVNTDRLDMPIHVHSITASTMHSEAVVPGIHYRRGQGDDGRLTM